VRPGILFIMAAVRICQEKMLFNNELFSVQL
jgi:hypothetical protein